MCEISICYLSDDLNHGVLFVHQLKNLTTDIIKATCATVKIVKYFTDGCAAQYKNCKSMLNLCHHKDNFGINATWSYFATSHSKSPCDGIGGAVKRTTAKAL